MYCHSPNQAPALTDLPEKVLAFIGGGGKTTLIYHLASCSAAQGRRVIVTTTTHIYFPNPRLYAPDVSAVHGLWERGSFAVIGTPEPGTGKLTAPNEALLTTLIDEADLVLIEADGAKGHPLKIPRPHEPVLHPSTERTLAVVGLTAFLLHTNEAIFAPLLPMISPLWAPQKPLWEAVSDHILSPLGCRKGVENGKFAIILNQCDSPADLENARKIAANLEKSHCRDPIYFTAFSPSEREKLQKLAKEGFPK